MRAAERPILLDLRDVGTTERGVARTLVAVGRRLLARDSRYRAACAAAGLSLLDGVDRSRLTVVGRHPQAVYEQLTLPLIARRAKTAAVFSMRECGALWGPPLLLLVPEDPNVRWSTEALRLRDPSGKIGREAARRAYSRLLMDRSLRRARVVTSTVAVAHDLERAHGVAFERISVVPYGVDFDLFHPVEPPPGTPYLFQLSADDARDHSLLVVEAFARFAGQLAEPVRLVIAGDLGSSGASVAAAVDAAGLSGRVDLPGRVSDERLVELYSGALATVVASSYEGFGLQAIEAMACGSLLVAVGAAATTEVIGGAEVVWTELGAGQMAAAFQAVWSDPERVRRAASVNREFAGRYSWDATAGRLHELLCELAG